MIANARAALVTPARLLSSATLTQALRRHVRLMRVAQLSHQLVLHQEALDLLCRLIPVHRLQLAARVDLRFQAVTNILLCQSRALVQTLALARTFAATVTKLQKIQTRVMCSKVLKLRLVQTVPSALIFLFLGALVLLR